MGDHCDCLLAGQRETNFEGNLRADLLFVGESPGYEELKEGLPFKGRSGRLLTNTIQKQSIPMDICFFANSARCMIQKDNLTQKEINSILKSCRIHLETIIHHVSPKLIVPLGAIALQQVMSMKGIKKARGNFYWSEEFNCWVLPNWHPAYILRNANEEDNFIRVFRTIREFVENDFRVKDDDDFTYMEVDSIRELLDGGFQRASDDSCYITAIDTETQGLKWFTEDSITISYSVAASDSEGWNVVLYEECPVNKGDFVVTIERGGSKKSRELIGVGIKKTEGFDRKIEELKELLSRRDIQKYYANQKYEMHRFEQLGINVMDPEQFVNNPIDIMLLAHTFDSPRYANANLGYLLESYCNISSAYKEEWTEAELEDMLTQLATQRDKFNRRACFDAVSTLRVALAQIKELESDLETLNYYVKFAHPIETGILYELERNGVQVDEFELPNISAEIVDQINKKIDEFKVVCPEPVKGKHYEKFNLTRRTIMMDALFKYEDKGEEIDIGFGIVPTDLSPKTKLPKVSKDVLKVLLDSQIPEKAKELIVIYQEWGEFHTMRSRYIKQIDENIAPDGRMYPTYSLTYTTSGRTGARRPSVQNFPKRSKAAALIRKLIVAPDGKKLLETDHSMCLVPETDLITVEGVKTLAEVIENKIPVLTCNDNFELAFKKVNHGRSTGVKDIYRMYLSDGSFVDCSELHKFRMYDGSIQELKDIRVGDKLLHVHSTTTNGVYPSWFVGHEGYVQKDGVLQPFIRYQVHRLVGDFIKGSKLSPYEIAHHKNEIKTDWSIENIEIKNVHAHARLHSKGKKNANYGNRKGEYKTCPNCGIEFYTHPSQSDWVTCSRQCSNEYFPRNKKAVGGNHKVVSIEYTGKRETFQIEVDEVHNYVLANGLCSLNSELRWTAEVAKEPTMKEIFKHNGDIHLFTGADIAGYPLKISSKSEMRQQLRDMGVNGDQIKQMRQNAKAVNFGLIYLMSAYGLRNYAYQGFGVKLSDHESNSWREGFFNLYPGIAPWHEKELTEMEKKGSVVTVFGRKIPIPNIYSDDKKVQREAERFGINALIQCPSSDYTLLGGDNVVKSKEYNRQECRPVLFIHDSIVWEVDMDKVGEYSKIVIHGMTNIDTQSKFGFTPSVPFVAEAEEGYNLADMIEYNPEEE